MYSTHGYLHARRGVRVRVRDACAGAFNPHGCALSTALAPALLLQRVYTLLCGNLFEGYQLLLRNLRVIPRPHRG